MPSIVCPNEHLKSLINFRPLKKSILLMEKKFYNMDHSMQINVLKIIPNRLIFLLFFSSVTWQPGWTRLSHS